MGAHDPLVPKDGIDIFKLKMVKKITYISSR